MHEGGETATSQRRQWRRHALPLLDFVHSIVDVPIGNLANALFAFFDVFRIRQSFPEQIRLYKCRGVLGHVIPGPHPFLRSAALLLLRFFLHKC